MPINTSFPGNIPWLLTEPPTAALARGAAIGQGIAASRARNQQLGLEAAQLEQQAARDRTLEAHRKIQEGVEQAQEARQQAIFARTSANELSRRIGIGMFSDEMEIWRADHPDASPSEELRAQTSAALKHADKMFPDGQGFAPFLQHATQAIGNIGVQESLVEARKSGVGFAPSNEEKLLNLEKRLREQGDAEAADAIRAKINVPKVQQELAGGRAVISGVRTADTLREHGVEAPGVTLPKLIAVERPITTATITENQKRVSADELALDTLTEALGFIRTRPEAFGPQGIAMSAAERARSIATGGKGPLPITEARQSALRNFITMADGLRVDSGNMNQKELALLKEAGDVTGFLDDPGVARTKLEGLARLKLQQLKKRYEVLNRKPPVEILKKLDDTALADAVLIGLFTQEQGEAEYNRRRKAK